MADIEQYRAATMETIGWSTASVSPNDSADLPQTMAAITCLVAGNISVITSGGTTDTLYCQAGGVLPVYVDRVRNTGTTATGIVAIYQRAI